MPLPSPFPRTVLTRLSKGWMVYVMCMAPHGRPADLQGETHGSSPARYDWRCRICCSAGHGSLHRGAFVRQHIRCVPERVERVRAAGGRLLPVQGRQVRGRDAAHHGGRARGGSACRLVCGTGEGLRRSRLPVDGPARARQGGNADRPRAGCCRQGTRLRGRRSSDQGAPGRLTRSEPGGRRHCR